MKLTAWKGILLGFTLAAAVWGLWSLPVGAAVNSYQVNLDGVKLSFDQKPEMRNNRVLVPLRKIFEGLGAKVSWDATTQTITATKGKTAVNLTVGSADAYVDGKSVKLDQPPVVVNDRTLVPIRFIGEAFGAKVDWDGENSTVSIIAKERQTNVTEAQASVITGMRLKAPDQKIAAYRKAIDLDPNFTMAYYLLGKELSEKLPDQAMEAFNKCLQLDPKYVAAYIARGDLNMNLLKYDQAVADYDAAAALNPNDFNIYMHRGAAYLGLNQKEQSFADLNKAVEMEPKLGITYATRGYVYAFLRNKDQAINDLKKAVEMDPESQDFRKALQALGVKGY